jgi:hypothetical protein
MQNFEVLFVDKLEQNKYDRLDKYLTNEIWNEYSHDQEFKECVYPGIKERASMIALVAVTPQSYSKFSKIFNACIEDKTGHKENQVR